MTTPTELEELKAKQQKTWSSGDYAKIAWLTVPLADVLCDAVEVRPGSAVLDVATGTGHVALAAARRFCDTTGIDYVPALIDAARSRAEAEALPVDFRVADAEDLPFEESSFDFVLSAIGVMFTAGHQRAADELVRVCKPGGRVGLVSWTPSGFVGRLLKTVGQYAPPPAGAQPPVRWGSEDTMRQMLGSSVSEVRFRTESVPLRFLSADQFADFFLTHYGPTLKASERLDDDGKPAFRKALSELATEFNRAADDTVLIDWEFLLTVADRA
ncbi:class I SAM-dependent methyltransferase [Glycomyces xiaoerkulensis]|uniref:class I SAM-dependent methyltransferase n=1 Tax=Glycomyces xiaoerkulensis TaxID=2038139 RepID=UPI000C2698C8|nr:class I SAM-dependent methyltransferase [Glycomyces xiaoerkulensis]